MFLPAQKIDGLASTPPMGWNSWNKFACDVNEDLIRETAEAMVSSGLRDAGYQYIIIDDCWHGERDAKGFIHAHPERFPSGIKALSDYIHSLDLKFGIYSDAGWKTCGGRPGSRGHEFQDALTFAEWGVDYLKYDWCYTEGLKAEGAYMTMAEALKSAGRPIVFSICEWGSDKPWEWGPNLAHLWRTTGDITAIFDGVVDHGEWKSHGILQILDMQEGLRIYAGPDHWNDPDMMEVGNGMSPAEDRAHFSLWCMLAAPLIAGNDLVNMSAETRQILTSQAAIDIDQDPLGIQGFKYLTKESIEVWFKPLIDGQWAVCFLNRDTQTHSIDFNWKYHSNTDGHSQKEFNAHKSEYKIYDIWANQDSGTTNEVFPVQIPGHDVVMLRLTPKP